MSITRSLSPSSIALSSSAADSGRVLRTIAQLVVANPIAASLDADTVCQSLEKREAIGSTGLGRGIAIPHCAIAGLPDFVVGLVTTAVPVDFQSIDGRPADVFFFIVGPPEQRNRHIKLLSAISKFIAQDDHASLVRAARDPGDLRETLIGHLALDEKTAGREKSLFQIFVQDLDRFEDVLNLLSSIVPGSISVLETRNAGAYLFKMPLFAAFWTESSEQEGRIILAVVDGEMTNSVIRQVQDVVGDLDAAPGVLITVQSLTYAAGALSF